ncbi:TlpA disulfide reductase family protein [Novosphingobium sp.]|uniref:TlpA family protein disulfide reductase n=1 Tax=Novosphingobium sp. TaxID=1874826 RepID=UPI0025E62A5A|nr:TlpA disulfide reductase family protein [Novosphingobium sp.]
MLLSRSLTLAVLGLPLVLGGCDRETAPPAQPQASPAAKAESGLLDRSKQGSAMPDFMLKDASGKQAPLASFKGKPLLINLWATWCAPCVAELPALDKLAKDRADSLTVLAVSQDLDSAVNTGGGGTDAKVAAFLKERAPGLAPWRDGENNLAFHYNAQTLPTTIYYDAKGREVWRYTGAREWTSAETAKLLDEAG